MNQVPIGANETIAAELPHSAPRPRTRWSLQGRPAQLALALLSCVILTLTLYLLLPWCFRFWEFSLTRLLTALTLDEARVLGQNLFWPGWQSLETPAIQLGLASPGYHAWLGNLGGALLLYLLAGLLRPATRSALRALAVFHLLAVLGQGLSGAFPYDLAEHTRSLSVFSIGLLLCLPAIMAATHYIVERSHERRILATLLIAAWLILSLPLKLLAHTALLQLASPLAMPTLFLVFGPALDILLVSALYAWAVSWRHHPD